MIERSGSLLGNLCVSPTRIAFLSQWLQMLGVAAQRIVHAIRKPRNNADGAIAAKPGRDGAFRAICCVAPLANGAYHWLRIASCISSRKAAVATTRGLRRGSSIAIGSALMIGAACCYGAEGAHWTYSGATGPAKWSSLDKGFTLCKTGTAQSPIDIPDADARKGDLPPLLFNYKPSPLRIVDNGHTIEVNYAPGSFVSVAGKRYELVTFHFHKPGEQKVDGKGHDMEAQLVHKDADGKLIVLAVELDAGKENPLIKTLWDNLPQDKGKERIVDAVKINALELLPQNKGYYTFAGSMTTPPCSESMTWFVLKTPVQVSAEEIARFGRIYPMNARPVQPVNGRDIQATL